MNPYLQNLDLLESLKESYRKAVETREEMVKYINQEINLLARKISEIEGSCTHGDNDGKNALKYIGQDPGSGKSEHRCEICGYTK